jgi:UDP-N-acetylglucosamine acyltransferase
LIHPTAVVDPKARLASQVEVSPYAIIGADVELGEGTWVGPHAVLRGPTRIGKNNKIFQFCSIGDDPQDKKYGGERTHLEIGDGNVIREYCTINRGTVQDAGVTRVGDGNWIMAYVHIAHDCQVGNHTVFANNASLAGHVRVGDYAILGGFTVVHQFCAIGTHSFSALGSIIWKDVPPYVTVSGYPAAPYGLNTEGLSRIGMTRETVTLLRRSYKVLYKQGLTLEQAMGQLREMAPGSDELQVLLSFLETAKRGIVR